MRPYVLSIDCVWFLDAVVINYIYRKVPNFSVNFAVVLMSAADVGYILHPFFRLGL